MMFLGQNGYVASSFAKLDYGNQAGGVKFVSRTEVNYLDGLILKSYLKDVNASYVVNAAGCTGKRNVDA